MAANQLSEALKAWGFRRALEATPLSVRTPRTFRQVDDLLIVGDDECHSWVAVKSDLSLKVALRIAGVFNAFNVKLVEEQPLHTLTVINTAA